MLSVRTLTVWWTLYSTHTPLSLSLSYTRYGYPPRPLPVHGQASLLLIPNRISLSSSTLALGLRKPDPLDRLMESFLGLSEWPYLSLDLSFDSLLESRPCDSDQDDMIDRNMRLGSALLEASRRSARKRATFHNAVVWALPPDLTIKVCFSQCLISVCYAAATYTFFHKCASDPLCYANIGLTAVV
ncbi:hypothetical protein Acr_18g0002060 [Actinidia rufa]|uniref:Uncharacterized protein n=1 Tax=Actinidia rufa TaxID=165716 RepID=A0A7J0G5I8_9ERIC|nr:hypothetical protein Acr_18g0002060 [Actinidia rufa]